MAVSFWGVDHGDEVSKSDKAREYLKRQALVGSLSGAPGVIGTAGLAGTAGYAAARAKKGKRGRAALATGGRALGGAMAGGIGGLALTRSVPGVILGGAAGGATGSYMGAVSNVKHGRIAGLRAEKHPAERSRKSR